MAQIDQNQPVMVTGATGYVAGWIVQQLLDQGITVHAAVRDPTNKAKLKYLDQLADNAPGHIRYFQSDLLQPGSYAEAMQGCQLVFHTASPFTLNVKDPLKDLVEPAQLGTRNVLQQANQTLSVRRVVVTSSCAAIYGDNCDMLLAQGPMFTEQDWNTTSSLTHQPYSYSKTLAEREAWNIAEAQDRWYLRGVLGGYPPNAPPETHPPRPLLWQRKSQDASAVHGGVPPRPPGGAPDLPD